MTPEEIDEMMNSNVMQEDPSMFDDIMSKSDNCGIFKELYVSKDLGRTWKFVADYVLDYNWYTLIYYN